MWGGLSASRSSSRVDYGRGHPNLRGYLFCCLGLAAALPVLLLGVVQLPKWQAKQLDQLERERRFAAETLAEGITQFVTSHVRAVESVAAQVQLFGTADPTRTQALLASQRARYGGFCFMYIAGRGGVSLVADPPRDGKGRATAGTDYSDRDYYRQLLSTRRTAISRVQQGRRAGVPSVQIAAPILDRRGEVISFVEGSLDLDSIQAMAQRVTRGIPELKVAVLDHHGRVIAFPDAEARTSAADLSQLPLFSTIAGNGVEVRTGEDNHGTPMRATAATVSDFGLDWTVVVYRPLAYQLHQAAVARDQVLTVAALALLVGLVVAALLSAALARPIRRLVSIATAVSHGDFSAKPDRPHALVPREIAALQLEIRHMVDKLKDHTAELEQQIAERTEQVRKAAYELEGLIYTVSHDLKLPVVSLYGTAALLQQQYGDSLDEQGRQYLRRLTSNAGFMEQLICDMLSFSQRGEHEYHMERLDSEQVLRETLDQCVSSVAEAGVEIKVLRPLPEVVFDRTALCRIFLNLLCSAMKYMGAQPHPRLEIGGYQDGEHVEYFIKDNGLGIDPQYHDQVFSLLPRREMSGGEVGIGLASAKKILESNGGRIWFRSAPGQGTTFFFRIPLLAAGLSPEDHRAPRRAAGERTGSG